MIHAAKNRRSSGILAAIPAEDLKMPLPMVEPISTVIVLNSPSFRGSSIYLHHAVVAPGPAGAQVELLDSARSGFGIVKGLRIENDSQLVEQLVESGTSISQTGKFDAVAIYIPYRSLFAIDDELAQSTQLVHLATEKLDDFPRVLDRAAVDDHCGSECIKIVRHCRRT